MGRGNRDTKKHSKQTINIRRSSQWGA